MAVRRTTAVRRRPTNHYASAIHARMADGKAYAFAFNDVDNDETLVRTPAVRGRTT